VKNFIIGLFVGHMICKVAASYAEHMEDVLFEARKRFVKEVVKERVEKMRETVGDNAR
jgi:hypothetical protein